MGDIVLAAQKQDAVRFDLAVKAIDFSIEQGDRLDSRQIAVKQSPVAMTKGNFHQRAHAQQIPFQVRQLLGEVKVWGGNHMGGRFHETFPENRVFPNNAFSDDRSFSENKAFPDDENPFGPFVLAKRQVPKALLV